jgi:hypothetical protein
MARVTGFLTTTISLTEVDILYILSGKRVSNVIVKNHEISI